MEVEVKETLEPAFKPITLEVTITSEEELINLWYRLNLPNAYVRKYVRDNPTLVTNNPDYGINSTSMPLFNILDELLKDNVIDIISGRLMTWR